MTNQLVMTFLAALPRPTPYLGEVEMLETGKLRPPRAPEGMRID